MKIGFDFDKVFINYPPFVPYFVIDFLYKGRSVFRKKTSKNALLHYRIPGRYEQQIRILSHHPILRNLIDENYKILKEVSKNKKNKTYLVSSRFSFLKNRTENILKKYSLEKYFDGIYFNFENTQPHLFKEKTIKKLGIDIYIDDDIQLAYYLSAKMPKLLIFWIHDGRNSEKNLPKNIIPIRDLRELKKHLQLHEQ